ncbi:rod shape-determining protein MreC [Alienimonas californiensis]|uniref:Cell shape-determining protein MreC n=1 Tax=Alienimonas californiensis TaxID=2527989 RepID=A0A517PBY8_9PLAN|nr:rod shape-determining protein MreC [Alienimonas californiensis]QDT16895.1 Cell shape-determining protein MreC [Alienimonas californiensis]
MSGALDDSPRSGRGLWPTAAAIALGALLAAAPPGVELIVRTQLHDLAGPVLSRLPASSAPAETAEAPVAELAREVARLRTELAATPADAPADRLVGPLWLTAATLGTAERRGAVAELLIARVGTETAADDVALLTENLPAIDAGADRQVHVGDLVVTGGAVVGRIAAAGRWTATVRPVTDADFRLAVTVPGNAAPGGGEEATAVLAGDGDAGAVLLHVPTAATIAVGAVVACEAAETGGAAVPVGVVSAVEPAAADGRRLVRVRPLATLAGRAGGAVQVVRAGLNRRRVGSPEEQP